MARRGHVDVRRRVEVSGAGRGATGNVVRTQRLDVHCRRGHEGSRGRVHATIDGVRARASSVGVAVVVECRGRHAAGDTGDARRRGPGIARLGGRHVVERVGVRAPKDVVRAHRLNVRRGRGRIHSRGRVQAPRTLQAAARSVLLEAAARACARAWDGEGVPGVVISIAHSHAAAVRARTGQQHVVDRVVVGRSRVGAAWGVRARAVTDSGDRRVPRVQRVDAAEEDARRGTWGVKAGLVVARPRVGAAGDAGHAARVDICGRVIVEGSRAHATRVGEDASLVRVVGGNRLVVGSGRVHAAGDGRRAAAVVVRGHRIVLGEARGPAPADDARAIVDDGEGAVVDCR